MGITIHAKRNESRGACNFIFIVNMEIVTNFEAVKFREHTFVSIG